MSFEQKSKDIAELLAKRAADPQKQIELADYRRLTLMAFACMVRELDSISYSLRQMRPPNRG